MENKEIYQLAERFWNGQTSEQEEKQLRNSLQWNEVPKDLEPLAEYLKFTEEAKHVVLGQQFDQDVLAKIDKPTTRLFSISSILKVAAVAILLIASIFLFRQSDTAPAIADQSEFIDTYEDSEVAYREVRNALMMVSTNMNQGMSHTMALGKFDQVRKKTSNQ